VEALGFAGLYRFDHFVGPAEPPDPDCLDLTVSLAYLATHTQRIHFGPLVAPLSFRDPHLLARQATAIDDLSGGRMILGVGAGWLEREHTMFGYDLGDIATRMDRLEEGLAVLTGLLRSSEPFTYEGRFFHLRDAVLLPRPQRPGGPPILLGGKGPKRALPLVARYADIWNTDGLLPNEVRDRSLLLDQLLYEAGRQPKDVKRTANVRVFCGIDLVELVRRFSGLRYAVPEWADLPPDTLLHTLSQVFSGLITGTPKQVVEQLRTYAEVGVEELMIQWTVSDDIEGLRLLAEYILPHFSA
jgi:alkanesulfonate monooxygenase SsuD/methylene tetrahydromethanopterin reductase-like flavin-dependent oxidoreductase (luciferase family)